MATISKRGGSWFVQIRRKGYAARYRTFRQKGDAQRWAREAELGIDNRSASTVRNNITLGDLLERYKREISPKKRGAPSEVLRIGKMQRAPMAFLTVPTLSPNAIAAYRDERLNRVKPGTVKREMNLLHHVIEVASKEWGLFHGANPLDMVSKPAVCDQRERRLQEGEWDRLADALASVRNPYLAPVVNFALATAMRRSEILSLKWPDIDVEKGVATVRQSKNGRSRTVPLSRRALLILQHLTQDTDRVFCTSSDAVKNGWNRVRAKSQLNDFRFHDLRHEAISRLFEIGLSVVEVCHVSGHRDIRMLARYTHLKAEEITKKLHLHWNY